jgi:hypothetical protein
LVEVTGTTGTERVATIDFIGVRGLSRGESQIRCEVKMENKESMVSEE